MCCTSIALVTDHDAGVEGGEAVTHDEVLRVFGDNIERLKTLLHSVIPALPTDDDCPCQHALDGLPLPFEPAVTGSVTRSIAGPVAEPVAGPVSGAGLGDVVQVAGRRPSRRERQP
ncbi:hypothetical protein GCM10025868_15790 [Angustibacter aerolatus]|uniref:S-methyl-5'-thioadenosine phosphorylase n=1 Tax=Angustibacter aerolatus TaxID=1162965 RepID=A0ABQ6JGS9_9ACTN|nr:hypothetical protein GCM10025868_15790 [Angustibacter aerolatus]